MFEVFEETSPLVEALSIDEAFLDVRGMERIAGSPAEIAVRLRREVRERVGLPVTVGVASDQVPRQGGQRGGQARWPAGGPAGGELAFLHPLPVERLWGVGPVTARKLRERGIETVGRSPELGEEELVSMLGPGLGPASPRPRAQPRSPPGAGRRRAALDGHAARARRRSPKSPQALDAVLVGLVDRLGRRLRKARRVCRTVMLRLRFDDFTRATRSHTLPRRPRRPGRSLRRRASCWRPRCR